MTGNRAGIGSIILGPNGPSLWDNFQMDLIRHRSKNPWAVAFFLVLLTLAAGCSDSGSPTATSVVSSAGASTVAPAETIAPTPDLAAGSSYVLFNQRFIEGTSTVGLDLDDVDAVFWKVFSGLPDAVHVYPSENYYYFIMYEERKQLWGNIRLPAGRRDRGILSFAYFEFKESPFVTEPRVKNSKLYTIADDLEIDKRDHFTYDVSYRGKKVTFNLHQMSQEQPVKFKLADDEVSTMRTFDESGYQFFLLYNSTGKYFTWVLNEEELVPDELVPVESDLLVGRRSGFAFWVDPAHPDRKALVAIRGANATVNNYYDGPFDQLADNYVDETNISDYMVKASPGLEGRLDKYGYFLDRDGSSRLAISPYFVYFSDSALQDFVRKLRFAEDPYFTLSRRGIDPTPTPSP